MGEYEDRYPDAYGHNEVTETDAAERHFSKVGLTRQVRDAPGETAPADSPTIVRLENTPAAPEPPQPATRRPPPDTMSMIRTPRQICDDISEQLTANPYIDAGEVTVTMRDDEVTLDGTINSLIAVSMARAIAENTAGVHRVQMQLKVRPAARRWETVPVTDPAAR
jgi:hypothetical protein